ncbi:outer membrane beta-barrel protein [Aquimarina aquimarini]|uniref:outer membrane beta-barrel protein n=1 Tax=Aquimarina aquimarini TaxID=1191734 RepID=UPI000D55A1CB|nr:outer membrane beta-barrel protein [Aquimarina aquimarini]
MRNFLLLAAVTLLGMTATNAQVKLGFGLGYAIPSGDIADMTDGGFSGNLEIGYGVTEDIDVSLVYQGDFLVGGDLNTTAGELSYGAVALGSYLVNGRYYFKKEGFRPYGSLALGLTSVGSVDIETAGTDVEVIASTSNFAFRPALGFKYGVLNVNATYLNAGKIGSGVNEINVSDFTVNVGLLFTIGG